MRFIVVDDEPLALRDLSEILRKVVPDCEIVGCSTASEALKTVQNRENGDFDVAFLDIELGSGNGITLAKAMKDVTPDLHIIFVTAYDTYALRAFEVHATGYLLKPALEEDIRRELTFLYKNDIGKRVRVQTFGGFDVFVDGKPLVFRRAKAKELLALLVDRRGNVLTAREAICLLYEDDGTNDRVKLDYFRTLVHDIRRALSEAGVPEILVRSRNALAVRADLIDCDSYRFLQGDPVAINSYRHDYMIHYSWAEYSVGAFENPTDSDGGIKNKE